MLLLSLFYYLFIFILFRLAHNYTNQRYIPNSKLLIQCVILTLMLRFLISSKLRWSWPTDIVPITFKLGPEESKYN